MSLLKFESVFNTWATKLRSQHSQKLFLFSCERGDEP